MALAALVIVSVVMIAGPANPVVVGVQAAVVAAGALALGYLIVDALLGRKLDTLMCASLALPGLLLYSLCLMLLHIASGGRILASPIATRALTLIVFLACLAVVRRRRSLRAERRVVPRIEWAALIGTAFLALVVWGLPLLARTPVYYQGDEGSHLGWINQLLNGDTVPTSALAGVPNYYPWLFHGLGALLTWFTPGSRAFLVVGPLQLVTSAGMALGLFGLGRQLDGRWTTGAFLALFGALAGGFGFIPAHQPDLVVATRGPAKLQYWGDLFFNRPYSYSFNNLVPPYPRDLSFALVPGCLALLLHGLRVQSLGLLAAVGTVVGLIALVHEDAAPFLLVLIAVLLVFEGRKALRLGLPVLVPALLLWVLWAVPLLINYVHLGGFRQTVKGLVSLPPLGILGAWGIVTLLGVLGAGWWLPLIARSRSARVILATFMASAVMIFAAPLIPRLLGSGFGTLGLQHRYWPFMSLAVSLSAAIGASRVMRALMERRRRVGITILCVICVTALASPVLGSLGFLRVIPATGVLYPASLSLTPSTQGKSTLLGVLAPHPGMRCTIAVPPRLSFAVFAFTGYRQVLYVRTVPGLEKLLINPRQPFRDLAFIRWKNIYEHIPDARARVTANQTLTRGAAAGGGITASVWRRVARKWGVNEVVTTASRLDAPGFRGLPVVHPQVGTDRFAVVKVSPCS